MRTVCWFSCGAASAVATKIAISESKDVVIVYTEVAEEHPDNKRFLKDCEKWFGQEIQILKNEKYQGSIFSVFEKQRYIVGIAGAPCTKFLKKEVREKFEQPTDRQVFGYTADEQSRLDRFIDANNHVNIWCPLIEKSLSKEDCLAMLKNANIELPAMYRLGYHNNNCIGCVKGGAGY
jgi:3'-phosphoadenosine 5'-phosphosulfate sulfotransferase (PAPS reductase)/FAD synthetase